MKGMKAIAVSLAAVVACPLFLTSCGKEKVETVNIVLAAQYVPQETVDAVQRGLDTAFPAETAGFSCSAVGVSSGDSESDPMAAMAGMMKLTGMIASKEADVLVASLTEGEKQAKAGSFLPLEELFTEEELADLDLVAFDITNEDGTADEENSKPCGIRLYSESLVNLDSSGMAVYIITNTERPEKAKEVFWKLAETYQDEAAA